MIVVPTSVLIFTTYKVTKLLNVTTSAAMLRVLSDERSQARLKRNQSITRMLIGIIVMFLICHTGKVLLLIYQSTLLINTIPIILQSFITQHKNIQLIKISNQKTK